MYIYILQKNIHGYLILNLKTQFEVKPMKKYLALFSILILIACSQEQAKEEMTSRYPNANLLINATELAGMLDSPGLLIIDTRSTTAGEFIPGAVHFNAVPELADPDHPVQNFLVGPDTFREKMRKLGVNNDSKVVIYDGGNSLSAARLFYALEYYGFSNVSILNGGLAGWKAEALELSGVPAEPAAGNFEVNIQEARFCDFDYVTAAAGDPDKVIFDVRSAGEYTGEVVRAERGGHIPNAANLEWSQVLENEGVPYFLPADEIQAKYDSLGITRDKEVIPHCQTNVRGSHAYFTLRLMGYDSVRPYEASWAEYGNREDAEVVN